MKNPQQIIDSLSQEDRNTLKSFFDQTVGKAIKTYASNHPSPDVAYKQLSARLDQIDAVRKASEQKAEIKTAAIGICAEKGLPFKIVEDILPLYSDVESLSKKINELASLSNQQEARQVNVLLAGGYKPGMATERQSNDLKGFSTSEAIALEGSGMLDRLIKGSRQ